MADAANRRKGLFGAYGSRGIGVYDHHGGKHGTAAESSDPDP